MVREPEGDRERDSREMGDEEGPGIWWITVVIPLVVLAIAYLIVQIIYFPPR